MKEDDFAAAVRKGQGSFAVTKIALQTGTTVIRGKGRLTIADDGFEIDFDVVPGLIPKEENILWNEDNFWSVTGLIEGDLTFRSDTVAPSGHTESWRIGRKPRLLQKLHFGPIELLPSRTEARSRARLRKSMGLHEKRPPTHPSVRFEAVLIGCDSLFRNAATRTEVTNDFLGKGTTWDGNTFIDRAPDYDFALIQEGADLTIHFRSKSRFRSVSEKADWVRFQALLNAIGFTHGFNPWPYRTQYWRGGRKIIERLRNGTPVTRTVHKPFSESIGRNGETGRRGAANSPIRIAARFFEKNSELTKNINELLYLFREAGGAVHLKIQTLALCSILEGLTNLLFDELKLETEVRKLDSHFDEFARMRETVLQFINDQEWSDQRSVARIVGSLKAAGAFRVREKFKALCDHFQLSANDMTPHLQAWEAERNPLSHGKFKSLDTDFRHQGLIAGVINIFVLKLMGFSGQAQVDIFGDHPRRFI
ncbi:MAG: hypothetical protein QOI07_2714 [Verrucomicrobiota bacterium]|jgi:hypothetical protein